MMPNIMFSLLQVALLLWCWYAEAITVRAQPHATPMAALQADAELSNFTALVTAAGLAAALSDSTRAVTAVAECTARMVACTCNQP
jgi:hypothetical protein